MEDIKIGGKLHSVATEHVVASASEIYDDSKQATQSAINEDTYRKSETYSAEQLNNMITTPNQEFATYEASDGDTLSDILPLTGTADTVYRVGNWDGEGYDATCYSEYAWDGTVYKLLDVKEFGIDAVTVANSNNLITSGGAAAGDMAVMEGAFERFYDINLVSGKAIETGDVGEEAEYGEQTASNLASIKLEVSAGDFYYVAGAHGGNVVKAITILASDNRVTEVYNGKPEKAHLISITQDGFLVVNTKTDVNVVCVVRKIDGTERDTLDLISKVGLAQGKINDDGSFSDHAKTLHTPIFIIDVSRRITVPAGFKVGRVVYYTSGGTYHSHTVKSSRSCTIEKDASYPKVAFTIQKVGSPTPDILLSEFPIVGFRELISKEINTAVSTNPIMIENDTIDIINSAGLYANGLKNTDGKDAISTQYIHTGKILPKNVNLLLPEGWLVRRICYYNKSTGNFVVASADLGTRGCIINNIVTVDNVEVECYAKISLCYKPSSSILNITPSDFPINNIGARLESLEIPKSIYPLMKFDVDYDMYDFEDEVSSMGKTYLGTPSNGAFSDGTFMERLYIKMEDLIDTEEAAHVGEEDPVYYITKYDAAKEATSYTGLSGSDDKDYYPEYAQGIEEVTHNDDYDVDYQITPAYKTYIYKLSQTHSSLYSYGLNKKKLFIVGCTHGWEVEGAFNAYLLAKNLCQNYVTNPFFMKLRSSFDIWILPCLNGYGIYRGGSGRLNGNGVNINRNAPTSTWVETDRYIQQGGETIRNPNYSGPSAGSEFETKIVQYFIDTLQPDIFIDHHAFHNSEGMFYTEGYTEALRNPAFNALNDLSFSCAKNIPTIFSKYNILVKPDGDLPIKISSGGGHLAEYSFEESSIFSFTIEVNQRVPYTDGEYDSTKTDEYSPTSFKIAECSLRTQLVHYINAMLSTQ